MKVVIGKNSRVFKMVEPDLVDFVSISHTEIESFDFADASVIYLFSWSKENLDQNISLIKLLPIHRLVFISTVAVLSLQLRDQISNYPFWKKTVEELVLSGGGRVIRLGICDECLLENYYGCIPFTTTEMLAKHLNGDALNAKPVTTLVEIVRGGLPQWKTSVGKFVNRISDLFPPIFILQVFLRFCLRAIGVFNYGYTNDAFKYFNNTFLCGFGVLGESYYKSAKNKSDISVIVSVENNKRIDSNGFKNTLIGYWKTGLARTWHGVRILKDQDGKYRKSVPFINWRPRLPNGYLRGNVIRMEYKGNLVELTARLGKTDFIILCKKVILAAGAIENTKLLMADKLASTSFSDHEVGMIGKVSTSEAVKMNLVREKLFLILPNHVLQGSFDSVNYLLDFRPLVASKHAGQKESNSFYLDSTNRLIVKLVFGFSFARINEAVFNKFGFGFRTKELSVCAQILAKDSILLNADGSMFRNRINKDTIEKISNEVSKTFGTFLPDRNPVLIDSQHILGGSSVLKDISVIEMIKNGSLIILGSPTNWCLGAFHHTSAITEAIINGEYNSLENVILE